MDTRRNPRVLIVEDDALVGEMIQGVLGEMAYRIAGWAVDGSQAIEMTRSLRPDAVLLDLGLSDMDGIEVARRIQEVCPTPVVVLTANASQRMVERASRAGVGAYLVKPLSVRRAERAITIAVARFDDMMELRRLNEALQTEIAERQQVDRERVRLIGELQEALDNVKTLSGLIPICAKCKKIRDDEGYWHQVETYVRDHTEARFSHGMCPDCFREMYPGYEHLADLED